MGVSLEKGAGIGYKGDNNECKRKKEFEPDEKDDKFRKESSRRSALFRHK